MTNYISLILDDFYVCHGFFFYCGLRGIYKINGKFVD